MVFFVASFLFFLAVLRFFRFVSVFIGFLPVLFRFFLKPVCKFLKGGDGAPEAATRSAKFGFDPILKIVGSFPAPLGQNWTFGKLKKIGKKFFWGQKNRFFGDFWGSVAGALRADPDP